MSASARIAAFVALLGLVFGAATFAGAELDPPVEQDRGHDVDADSSEPLSGLSVAEAGYRLVPTETKLRRSRTAAYSYRILDEAGATVRDFAVEHERRMHLIVVGRDFSNFQHLHPRQLADGGWEAGVDLSSAGVYRAFADFAVGDQSLTLATDLVVGGEFVPLTLPRPELVANAGGGYTVKIASDAPAPGTSSVLFTVARNGRGLESVEPYLGADGHLVALREHDQAYLHTHPEDGADDEAAIAFDVSYPTAGRYRLFLQFKHAGEVRTAAFTQIVGAGETAEEASHGH